VDPLEAEAFRPSPATVAQRRGLSSGHGQCRGLLLAFFAMYVAFSAYTWLLERCSATLVATHTYVNPVIAVLLGWRFAGEPLTPRILGATGLILAAVILLRADSAKRTADQRGAPCAVTARAGAD
jgi:drug/metabolite transporter (DMT)-like permease